jgi:hypothetical protein
MVKNGVINSEEWRYCPHKLPNFVFYHETVITALLIGSVGIHFANS